MTKINRRDAYFLGAAAGLAAAAAGACAAAAGFAAGAGAAAAGLAEALVAGLDIFGLIKWLVKEY